MVLSGLNANLTEWETLYARPTNWWNLNIEDWPVDPYNSQLQADAIARQPDGSTLNKLSGQCHPDFSTTYGMPVCVVSSSTPRVQVTISNKSESDLGPYPIPPEAFIVGTPNMYIENGSSQTLIQQGDRHLLMIDKDYRIAYELSYASYANPGGWAAGYGAVMDLKYDHRRPEGWTSTDAAGLCVAAGLIRWDEVYSGGEILHALRFCLKQNNGYIYPASHDNGVHYPGAPPLGTRIRLKADFDTVNKPGGGTWLPAVQKILRCLQKYGGLMADRGGSFKFQGTMDSRWTEWITIKSEFHQLKLSDFEFIVPGIKPKSPGTYTKKVDPTELE